jgi:peroxiredoxin
MNLLRTSLTITLGALLLSVTPLTAGKVPRPAASLEGKTLDGKTVSLSGLKGKVVAVLFFSTDCPHCQNTTRILNPIYDEWKARGLEIMGMAVNPTATDNLKSFAMRFEAKFPLALSVTSECNRFAEESVMRRFSVPYLFLVDRQGRVRAEHPGADREFWINQEENLRTEIDALLKEPGHS